MIDVTQRVQIPPSQSLASRRVVNPRAIAVRRCLKQGVASPQAAYRAPKYSNVVVRVDNPEVWGKADELSGYGRQQS